MCNVEMENRNAALVRNFPALGAGIQQPGRAVKRYKCCQAAPTLIECRSPGSGVLLCKYLSYTLYLRIPLFLTHSTLHRTIIVIVDINKAFY